MHANFEACLRETLTHEGGFSNHPEDPGGATMRGVTQRVYDGYRERRGLTRQTVRRIAEAELRDIYRDQYWKAVRGDDLPAGVDLAVFDYAVNSGPSRAIRALQVVLGVEPDGEIGEVTLAKAPMDDDRLARFHIDALCNRRMAFLRALKKWPTFGKGWTRRVDAVRARARAMTQAPEPLRTTEPVAIPAPPDAAQESAKAKPAPAPPTTDKAIAIGTAGAGLVATIVAAVQSPWGLAALVVVVAAAGVAAWRLWPRQTMPEMRT